MAKQSFESLDLIIFALMLSISVGIGIFFGCFRKKPKTTRYLLVADRNMGSFPVSMSLFASFMSGASILGGPFDTYYNDIMFCWSIAGVCICSIITNKVFLPLFIEQGYTSAYQYLEKRFSRKVKLMATFAFIFNTILYLAFVLYGPALA
ncbi:sodium-coupled monocarboxylate transporter 2-like, partial [Brachionus plicatilis]